MEDSDWIEGRDAIRMLRTKLGPEGGPDSQIGFNEQLEKHRESKQRALLAIQRAILGDQLVASHVSTEQTQTIPKAAFIIREVAGYCLSSGLLEIDPFWPDDWQQWNGKQWFLPRNSFLSWLDTGTTLESCNLEELPSLGPEDLPNSDIHMPLPETTFVSLSEALSVIAFGMALPAERLERSIRWRKFCDGSAGEISDCLMEAIHGICQSGSQSHIAFFGRYVRVEDEQHEPERPIAADELANYQKYSVGHDVLCRGSGVYWNRNARDDEPSEIEPGEDHFDDVKISRKLLLREFPPPENLATANVAAGKHIPSLVSAQAQCEIRLHEMMVKAPKQKKKEAFRKELVSTIKGLSGRAFYRAWGNVAPKYGRDKPGAKKKTSQ
jgi:hypothetical protein